MNSNYLVLVRHGQSEWNAKNLFTGWRDPGLTAKGVDEAHAAGKALKKKNLIFDTHISNPSIEVPVINPIILYCLKMLIYSLNSNLAEELIYDEVELTKTILLEYQKRETLMKNQKYLNLLNLILF